MDPNSRLLAMGAGGSADESLYVEDVFSTYLYTGNGSTQTITNGIDLAGEGGLVWIKHRNYTNSHQLYDTARGAGYPLYSNITNGQGSNPSFTAFTSSGFSLSSAASLDALNGNSSQTYASWTFRKAEKFFDVVTYTGNGSNPRDIAHSLGSTPGCVIIKRTDSTGDWGVWHRGTGSANSAITNLSLNATAAAQWTSEPQTTMTSTTFQASAVRSHGALSGMNVNGASYVAYLFAHDAGGFGDAGTDNVVSCGSYTGNGSASGPIVNLGWEPQWLLIKRADNISNWHLLDVLRGMPDTATNDAYLGANLSNAESGLVYVRPVATGFQIKGTAAAINTNASTYIYIAIRRGPMKTPTDATKVFAADIGNNTGSSLRAFDSGFPVDLLLRTRRADGANITPSRITGGKFLRTYSADAEAGPLGEKFDDMGGVGYSSSTDFTDWIGWMFRRAPGFFDVVAYTGNGATDGSYTVSHSLQAVPELILVKNRSNSSEWVCYHKNLTGVDSQINLNSDRAAATGGSSWNPQLTTFAPHYAGNASYSANNSSQNYIAYLFATLSGVSKVGSYTGTGTTLNIDCGFTAGSRLVLIKRTDSTGSWFIWDTARGIISGNDPYLLLNSTAAEVTSTDYIDPLNSGFQISSTAPAAINASGGSFIFLAIA